MFNTREVKRYILIAMEAQKKYHLTEANRLKEEGRDDSDEYEVHRLNVLKYRDFIAGLHSELLLVTNCEWETITRRLLDEK